jgi:hypothetical protein
VLLPALRRDRGGRTVYGGYRAPKTSSALSSISVRLQTLESKEGEDGGDEHFRNVRCSPHMSECVEAVLGSECAVFGRALVSEGKGDVEEGRLTAGLLRDGVKVDLARE